MPVIIEALKKVKSNRVKIEDLQRMISKNAAQMEHETNEYGSPEDVKKKIQGWVQSALDLTKENERLLESIARTNLLTDVTIEIGGNQITKSIAAWIYRRREFALCDLNTMQALNDGGRKDGHVAIKNSTEHVQVKVLRNYDPVYRDKFLDVFAEEPSIIDARLEIINATTPLIEN